MNTLKVLIVDDIEHIREYLKAVLLLQGHEVLEAENGRAALKVIEENDKVDLVLLDYMMPEMDGPNFLEEIRNRAIDKEFKICMTTAKSSSMALRECLRKGADDYIVKPIDKDLLNEKVSVLTGRQEGSKFFQLKTSISCELIHPHGDLVGKIVKLSENEISIIVDKEIPVGAKVQLYSDYLCSLFKSDELLIIRSVCVMDFEGSKMVKANFVGLNQGQLRQLRSLTLKGVEINEE